MIFYKFAKLSDKEALDAKATNSKPIVLTTMTDLINSEIQTELEVFDRSAKSLDTGSAEGKTLSQGNFQYQ